jgi:hypothetical protein
VRSVSPRLEQDRPLSGDLEAVAGLVLDGGLARLRARALAEARR